MPFLICTGIWVAAGASGAFWPIWVALFALIPLVRNGWDCTARRRSSTASSVTWTRAASAVARGPQPTAAAPGARLTATAGGPGRRPRPLIT